MNYAQKINIQNQKIIFWLGCAFPVTYGIAWAGIAGFFPPPAPNLPAQEIADLYVNHGVAIRLGMMICLMVNCLCIPWAMAIWQQMRRLEEGRLPIWSTFQLMNGILNVVFFMTPTCIWMTIGFVAQFRPDWPAEGIRVLNDLAWILWFTTYAVTTLQCWSLGYVGLKDERKVPVFPRWWCYLQFWVGLAYVPAGVVPFFDHGPFSWVGAVGLYVPVVIYFLWFPITAWGLWRAIKQEEAETNTSGTSGLAAA